MPQQIDVPGIGVVEFPDGMNDDQIVAAIKSNAPPSQAWDIGAGAVSGLGKGLTAMAGMGGDLREMMTGGTQWAAGKLGASPEVADYAGKVAGIGLTAAMPWTLGKSTKEVREGVEGVTGKFYEPKTSLGKYSSTIAEFAPAAIGGPASLVRRAGQVLAPAIASEAAGQAFEGKEQEGYARAFGAVAGSLAPSAIARLPRVVTPNPISAERQAANAVLQKEGVTSTTAGQATGKETLRYKESMAGGRAQVVQEEGLRQLTTAALRRIGETGHDTYEAVQRARPRIGNVIDSAAKKLSVRLDKKHGDDLVKVEQELLSEGLSDDQVRRILAQRDNILAAFQTVTRKGNKPADSMMTGTAFHNLIKTGSPLMRATQDADASVAHYANRLRASLMDAAERTATGRGTRAGTGKRKALEDFQKGRRDWANLRALEDVASNAGGVAAQGILSPAAIRQLATARERSDYARGRGDFAELARAANTILAPLPNSGTAQRQSGQVASRLIGGGIGGGVGALLGGVVPIAGPTILGSAGATLGATVGPAIQNSVLMSKPVQKWLRNQKLTPQALQNAPPWLQQAVLSALLVRPETMPALPQR